MQRPIVTAPYGAAAVAFPLVPAVLLFAPLIARVLELPSTPSHFWYGIVMFCALVWASAIYASFAAWFDVQARRARDATFPDDLWQGLISNCPTAGAFCYFSWVMRKPRHSSRRWRKTRPSILALALALAIPVGAMGLVASMFMTDYGMYLPARLTAASSHFMLLLGIGLHPLLVAWNYAALLARWPEHEWILEIPPPSIFNLERFYWRFAIHGLAPFRYA